MKLNRTAFRPIGPYQVTRPGNEKSNTISINKFGTLNNSGDSAAIEKEELVVLDNTDSVDGILSRRFGTTFLSPTKPNGNKVLNFEAFQENNSSVIQLRFDSSTIYRRGAASWTKVTGVSLTGTNKFYLASSDDEFFCANGSNKVIKFDFATNTMSEIASSQPYKYLASIGTRIVGAFNNDPMGYNPIEIGTSGNLNFSQWDPTVDFSAYRGFLFESQDSYTDFITGLAGVGETAVVMRERTIWLGEPQPVAQQPFYFYPKILNIGSDIPNSFQKVYGGVCFADRRTEMVYYYDPRQGDPIPIAVKVYKEMNLSAFDPTTIFSGWDANSLTYIIGIPQIATNIVYLWKYSFKTQGWTRDTFYNATSVSSLPYSTSSFTIDDAVGSIDVALGTIDEASPVVQGAGSLFIGREDGNILLKDQTLDTDAETAVITIDGLAGSIDSLVGSIDQQETLTTTTYDSVIVFKTFELEDVIIFMNQLVTYINPSMTGTIDVYYSKNNGVDWRFGKTLSFSSLDKNKRVVLEWMRLIRARQLSIKLVSSSGLFKLVKLAIELEPGGDIRV